MANIEVDEGDTLSISGGHGIADYRVTGVSEEERLIKMEAITSGKEYELFVEPKKAGSS